MAIIHWMDIHPSDQAPQLRLALEGWGFRCEDGPGDGTLLIVARHPDPRLIPLEGTEILWWVEDADPETVSAVLSLRPGWVLRQSQPLTAVRTALTQLQTRDLGSEGWLRQMLHLASLDELLRPLLMRAVQLSGAKGGAIWIRKDDICYQRFGDGFP